MKQKKKKRGALAEEATRQRKRATDEMPSFEKLPQDSTGSNGGADDPNGKPRQNDESASIQRPPADS
jgi:hypothetical protein